MYEMVSARGSKRFRFVPTFKTIEEILDDQNLAKLGDAYTNFVFSLYLSMKAEKPKGARAKSRLLSEALRRSGLREHVSSRVDRHGQADAVEALLVYVWLRGLVSISESLKILLECEDEVEAFSSLIEYAKEALGLQR